MTSLPPELQYGHVVGRVILAVADTGDADTYPDAVPAQGTVTFTPKNPEIRVGEPDPVVVLKQKIVCTIDSAGYLTDPDGKRGVWLVTGVYTVSYAFNAAALPAHDIVVGAEHTLAAPLDLTLALPPGGPVLQPSQYAELTARIDSLVFEAAGVSSVNGETGVVVLDADDVGALPSSYTPPAQSWADVTGKPSTFPPTIGTTASTAKAGNYTPTWTEVTSKPATFPPDTHGHAYSEITGTPTIPGPQTLSLTGSDLTLSDGGGTVTLPSGGGGGGNATGDVQFVVARTGPATPLAHSSFTTYPLDGTPTVNIGGGSWNASTFVYTIPKDGLYLCLGAIRIADGSATRNVCLAIHTSNTDGPFALWQNMGGVRHGAQYTRLTRFSAGQGVRMCIYSEGSAFTTQFDAGGRQSADGQSMSITKVAD